MHLESMALNDRIELILDSVPELQITLEELRKGSSKLNMMKNRLNGKEI